jgi:thiosulfate dehydrogenase [quinone] large subunit
MATHAILQSSVPYFLFSSTKSAALWLLIRLYVGWEWFAAGWDKVQNPVWFGSDAGAALQGFVQGALTKTTGAHPDVYTWYASFLSNFVSPNAMLWSNAVAVGEVLVGIGLMVGCIVGITAFFGVLMNLNYLFAGTVSVNPTFLILGILLMLSWRVAGYYGLDYYVSPYLRRLRKFQNPS